MSSSLLLKQALGHATSSPPSTDDFYVVSSANPPSDKQLAALTAVPSGSGSVRKKLKSLPSQHTTVGNDERIPWLRRVKDMTEVEIVCYRAPAAALGSSTTLTVLGSNYFTLADVPNSSSYTSVFDQYWIKSVEALLVPNLTENTTFGGGPGILVSAVDFDDANTPTLLSDVSNHDNAIESSGTTMQYHKFSPCYAKAVYSGAFTSFASDRGWIDCASPSVQHYGIKYALTATSAVFTVSILARLTVRFRGLH